MKQMLLQITELSRQAGQAIMAMYASADFGVTSKAGNSPLSLFDLIANEQKSVMLANTQKNFAFKVRYPAVEPDKKNKPKRSLIVILVAFVADFLAILYAFIKEGIAKRREEANSKLREHNNAIQ